MSVSLVTKTDLRPQYAVLGKTKRLCVYKVYSGRSSTAAQKKAISWASEYPDDKVWIEETRKIMEVQSIKRKTNKVKKAVKK